MNIRMWQAFASNNSGSYVIVGRFPSEALAAEVAGELLEVSKAHSAWHAARDRDPAAPSPLAAYAARLGVVHDDDAWDDWPSYSAASHPPVWAIGHQVFVHSDYTASMPRALGHLIYERGGRVMTEIDHAHHPVVAVFEVYFPWQTRDQVDVPARVQDLVDALCGAAGPLANPGGDHPPAWRGVVAGHATGFGESDLSIGAVLDDLCAGFTAVAGVIEATGAKLAVQVFEAMGEGDPLAFLRPCVPAALPSEITQTASASIAIT